MIGQGEVTATPLQVANAYAALVNGGTLFQPRVVDRVVDRSGEIQLQLPPRVLAEVELDDRTIASLRVAMSRVVNGPSGTAAQAYADFGSERAQIGGKTGTAQIGTESEITTAWFVGVAPIDDPEYVVAVVIERGGSSGRIAAPTARRLFEAILLGVTGGELALGAEAD